MYLVIEFFLLVSNYPSLVLDTLVGQLVEHLAVIHASTQSLLHHAVARLQPGNQITTRRVLPHLLYVVVLDLDALVLATGALVGQIQVAEQVGHVTVVLDVKEVEERLLCGLDGLKNFIVLRFQCLQAIVELLETLFHLVANQRLGIYLDRDK